MRVTMTRNPNRAPPDRHGLGLLADERGATAIEYALLASLVAILAIGGLQALSSSTGGLYGAIQTISLAIEAALTR
jgi:Flp pilus assembly pilin Flp